MLGKKCRLNLNLKSSLARKFSVPLIPTEQDRGKRNYPLGGKEAFPRLENYIPQADTYQLTLTMQITSSFHLGLQIVCGKISRLSDKAGVHFMYPAQKMFDYPLIFVQFPKPRTEYFLKAMSCVNDCCSKFCVKGLTLF